MKVSDPFFDWLTILPELLSCFDLVTPDRSQECQEQHRQKKRQLGGIHAEEWNRVAMAQRCEDQARESGKNAPYMLVVAKAPLSETG